MIHADITPQIVVSLVALGMGMSFLSADRRSRTSRALAVGLASMGVAIFLNHGMILDPRHPPTWSGWLSLPEALSIAAMLEWLLRVRRTVPVPANFNVRFGDLMLRVGQASAALYSVFSVLWPQMRLDDFMRTPEGYGAYNRPGFWLFATPILIAVLTGFASVLLLLNRRPASGERVRMIAFSLCSPFLIAGFVLPVAPASISVAIGEMILLFGSVQYHVRQGRLGLFMSRFLSPEVAKLVSERGLQQAMQEQQLTITAVACDLRGFSAYARAVPSQRVIQVLREYYDAVGQVVARSGGTIKDYAGDGILVLVGAPIPLDDHAARAVAIALQIRSVCQQLTGQWRGDGPPLGIGLGMATGAVTVGVIGGVSRLEYTAVGSAVNLASRLCEQAHDGEILIDESTQCSAGALQSQARPSLVLKGFGEPVAHFSI